MYTAGFDTFIIGWNIKGNNVLQIPCERVWDLHITHTGQTLIMLSATSQRIVFIDTVKKIEVASIQENDIFISSYLSKDSRFLLVNLSYRAPELHLWDLESKTMVNKFFGFKQDNFILRCSLGWYNDMIVSIGSEDGKVYLWHRFHNKPLKILQDNQIY